LSRTAAGKPIRGDPSPLIFGWQEVVDIFRVDFPSGFLEEYHTGNT